MKTLITGGYGLVGSEFYGDQYLKIKSTDYDLRDKVQVENLFKDHSIDSVIHCAARVGGLGYNMSNKGEFFYDNIMMNTNIVETSRKYNIKKFIGFLSTCIFPNDIEYPLTESKIHLGPPHSSNDAYAYAKRMLDIQIKSYREQYGLKYTSVIPCNIYGPNDNFSKVNGHVIPSLIHKCYLAKKENSDFVIWGSGKALREFIYSEDIAKLTLWALENYNENEPIIFSTSQETSISDLVEMIVELMNFKGKVIYDKTKPDGQIRKPSDNSKLKKYLPSFEFTGIYEGLKKTIDNFEKNYQNLRK